MLGVGISLLNEQRKQELLALKMHSPPVQKSVSICASPPETFSGSWEHSIGQGCPGSTVPAAFTRWLDWPCPDSYFTCFLVSAWHLFSAGSHQHGTRGTWALVPELGADMDAALYWLQHQASQVNGRRKVPKWQKTNSNRSRRERKGEGENLSAQQLN